MLNIRRAEPNDIRQVSYIHVDTWRAAYRGIIDRNVLNNLSYGRSNDNLRRCFDKLSNFFYVAEIDGIITGFATGGIQRDEDLLHDGEIYAMYILPRYQNRGIGSKLFLKMAEDFHHEKWHDFLVWCLEKNPAKDFYQRFGAKTQHKKRIRIGGRNLIEIGYVFETKKVVSEFIENK